MFIAVFKVHESPAALHGENTLVQCGCSKSGDSSAWFMLGLGHLGLADRQRLQQWTIKASARVGGSLDKNI